MPEWLWIALGVTGIMASSAATLYNAPLQRRKRGPSLYEAPGLPMVERSHVFDTPGATIRPEAIEPPQPA